MAEVVGNKLRNTYEDIRDGFAVAMGYEKKEFTTIGELQNYTVLGNEVKPCYFQDGTIYGYLYNGQANIHQEDYDSTIAKVQKVPVAFEVHSNTKYYLSGIDDPTGIGTFAWGSSSPSICASGVVNALGMFVDASLYENNATYWGSKLSQTNEWQKCKMYGGNTIPLLVNYSTKKAYIPEEFVFCCAKMIANEQEDWSPTGYIKDGYEFMGWVSTPKFKAVHGEASGRDTDEYETNGGIIYIDQGGYACVVSKTPLYNVNCHLKYTHDDGRIEDFYKTVNVTTHVTGDGYDYYTSGSIESFWRCNASDVLEKEPLYYNYQHALTYTEQNRYINALVNGQPERQTPDSFSVIPDAILTDMNAIKTFTDPSQLNTLLQVDMGTWKGNAISVTTVNADGTTRSALWYPIAIPYNFVDTPSIDFDPNSFYDTTQKPLGDPVNQIWNGGDEYTYTTENYEYITNNIYGPTNYYYYTINKKPSGDDDVNMPDYNTGKGPTMPDVNPPTDDSDSGIGGVYLPSRSELAELNYWLYNDEVSFDKLLQYFGHPSDAIVGLHQIYVPQSAMTKSTSKLSIQCGYLTAKTRGGDNLTAYKLEKRNCKMYMGHANIQEYFGNVFDYAPYTSLQLFLPWIGFVTLPISKVMRGDVECICNVDIVTGAFLYQINVTRDGKKVEIASYGGCMASQYPVTSGSYSNILGGIIGAVGGALGHSSIKGAIGGAIVGGVSKALDQSVNTSGGYGGSTGALGRKAPYIVVERTIPNMASDYNLYTGNPYNKPVSLGTCSGYTVIDNVRLNTNNMLYEDIVEVENLLRSGVVL